MTPIDETHDPNRKSGVCSAQGHPDFPIQNLPPGIFSPHAGTQREGVAIGHSLFDLQAALAVGVISNGFGQCRAHLVGVPG